jgi:hypothetical protein
MSRKPALRRIVQVAVAVRNVDAAVRKYPDEYGIEPWTIYEFNPDTVKNMIIRGEPQTYSMKIALANLGGVELELIEPLDEKSIYAEFLREHGEGLHHLAFDVENYDDTMEFFFSRGHKILQGGRSNGETYTYLDTRNDLVFITEIYKRPPDFQVPEPAEKGQ